MTRVPRRTLQIAPLGHMKKNSPFLPPPNTKSFVASGILPAASYLQAVTQSLPHWQRVWYAPTLLWFSSGNLMLSALCWVGLLASVLLVLNLWPRGRLVFTLVSSADT